MPALDGTGPMGAGPMTGRFNRGKCSSLNNQAICGCCNCPFTTKEDLKEQENMLKKQLSIIQEKIKIEEQDQKAA